MSNSRFSETNIEIPACQIDKVEISPEFQTPVPSTVPAQAKNNKSKHSRNKKGQKQVVVDQQVKPETSELANPDTQVNLDSNADQLIKQILEETPMQKAKNMIHSKKFRE